MPCISLAHDRVRQKILWKCRNFLFESGLLACRQSGCVTTLESVDELLLLLMLALLAAVRVVNEGIRAHGHPRTRGCGRYLATVA